MKKRPKLENLDRQADIKIQCKAIIIKTVWHQHKNRQIAQWNRMVSMEIDPQLHN